MCHDADSAPPVFGPALTVATATPLILTGTDGARFAAHLAEPESPSGLGVLVLPDNRGLSSFYEQLTVRLAEQGHHALAVDYYGRTAGLDHRQRPEFAQMDGVLPHLFALTGDSLYGDIDTGIAQLRQQVGTVVSLGFCMGGRFAFATAAERFGLAGVVGLYGSLDPINGAPGPIQFASEPAAPILGLFGGADPDIPAESVRRFDEALTAAGVPHELVTYEDAPHSFFDLHQEQHREASADAWARILDFLQRSR